MAAGNLPSCFYCGATMAVSETIEAGSGLAHFQRQQLICPDCGDADSRFVFVSENPSSSAPALIPAPEPDIGVPVPAGIAAVEGAAAVPPALPENNAVSAALPESNAVPAAPPEDNEAVGEKHKTDAADETEADAASKNGAAEEIVVVAEEPAPEVSALVEDAPPLVGQLENPPEKGAELPVEMPAAAATRADPGHKLTDMLQSYLAKWRRTQKD
jgi:hypothetical protein